MGLRELLFPPKCVLCGCLLERNETDLCHRCRKTGPEALRCSRRISFVAKWTAVWYYKDDVRRSLLRYKFYGRRSYAPAYGRLLAMKITQSLPEDFDVLTYVPADRRKRRRRGYDHVALIGQAVASELGMPLSQCLHKPHATLTQSTIREDARRRANVLNAYKVVSPEQVAGKRILLIDDIITTGATVSECAKTLLFAGAKEVYCACVAAAQEKK